MMRFIVRRLLVIPPALLLINFLGYAYAYLVAPIQAAANPYSTLQANLPSVWGSYGSYLVSLVHLNIGTMPDGNQPIIQALAQACTASLGLIGISLLLSIVIGLILGIAAVRSDPPRVSGWLTLMTTVGLSAPSFFFGVLLITLSILYIFWSPAGEPLFPFIGFGWDTHLIVPVVALMLRPMVQIAKITSGLMVDELGKQYVITSRSFGFTWAVIRRRHVMRNILGGVIVAVMASLRWLVAELLIVEYLVSWPGIGRMLVNVLQSDLFQYPPVLAALVTLVAVFLLVMELCGSTLIRVVDPRLRTD
jgi:ABC-type dipeptide/oligopeptide/nickel transport system permease component